MQMFCTQAHWKRRESAPFALHTAKKATVSVPQLLYLPVPSHRPSVQCTSPRDWSEAVQKQRRQSNLKRELARPYVDYTKEATHQGESKPKTSCIVTPSGLETFSYPVVSALRPWSTSRRDKMGVVKSLA